MKHTFILLAIAVVLVLIATALYSCQDSPGPEETTVLETTVSPGPDEPAPVIQYEALPDTGGISLGL